MKPATTLAWLAVWALPSIAAAQPYGAHFPETGARIAVFEAGPGFREELFARDTDGVFNMEHPGQPSLPEADIIVARVDDWAEAAALYDGTTLQPVADAVATLPADQPVHVMETEMFGGLEVLIFTFQDRPNGQVVSAPCMARFVIDTLYAEIDVPFDPTACGQEAS